MPVCNDFEIRFLSRLSGICSYQDDVNDHRGDIYGGSGDQGNGEVVLETINNDLGYGYTDGFNPNPSAGGNNDL